MSGSEHRIQAAVYCHIGGSRSSNEDNYYLDGIWKPLDQQNENQLLRYTGKQPALFAVCDGMGGQPFGEVASLLAVSWIHQRRSAFLEGEPSGKTGSTVLSQLSRRFWQACQERKCYMGSTIAMAAIRENTLYAYGLGDSRVYLLDTDGLQQLTQDHTVAAEAEFMGLTDGRTTSPSDSRSHQLTQYFGMDCGEYVPAPCCIHRKLRSGQRILLCSDGLSDTLKTEEMLLALVQETPADSVQRLVDTALEHGGTDNITTMVLAV